MILSGITLFTEQQRMHIARFIQLLCLILPCPACRLHAMKYVAQHPPLFDTPQQYWDYLVTFHNNVNEETHKMLFTDQEAKEALQEKCTARNITQLNESFTPDWFLPLIYSTVAYTRQPLTPSEQEQRLMKDLLESACYILPFSQCVFNGRTACDIMLSQGPIDTSTADKALDSVTKMFNAVAGYFNAKIETNDGMKQFLNKQFVTYVDLVRAHEIRLEDHKKMKQLEEKYGIKADAIANKATQDVNSSPASSNTTEWAIIIVLSSLLIVFILFWSMPFILKRVRRTDTRVTHPANV